MHRFKVLSYRLVVALSCRRFAVSMFCRVVSKLDNVTVEPRILVFGVKAMDVLLHSL